MTGPDGDGPDGDGPDGDGPDGDGPGGGGARPYTGGVGSRREAREHALALLYEAETKGASTREVLAGLPVPPDEYTSMLVAGVGDRLGELDRLISTHVRRWRPERLPALDRAILRMAILELLDHDEVPTAVVITEAVELAKRYSTDDSGRFVNGMLSTIAVEVRA